MLAAMLKTIWAALAILLVLPGTRASERQDIQSTREALSKWVEIRQLITRTRADWENDRELLRQTLAMFEKELRLVEEQSGSADRALAQVERERGEQLAAKEALQEAATRLSSLLAPLEKRILALSQTLPAPLRERIAPLLERIPENSEATQFSGAERTQTVVGLLSEIEKFNGAITVSSEIQKNARGEEVQVKTLYLGLAQAYWVDKQGRAGVGIPGPQGWEWKEEPGLAEKINHAMAMYESAQTAAFVSLPVTLK